MKKLNFFQTNIKTHCNEGQLKFSSSLKSDECDPNTEINK